MPELLTDAVKKALLERKLREAERALRDSETRFERLLGTANSIVLTADRDGTIKYMNPFGLKFFGYTDKELIGKNVRGHIIADVDSEGTRPCGDDRCGLGRPGRLQHQRE
jgi:PAS domain S-box-containing protein